MKDCPVSEGTGKQLDKVDPLCEVKGDEETEAEHLKGGLSDSDNSDAVFELLAGTAQPQEQEAVRDATAGLSDSDNEDAVFDLLAGSAEQASESSQNQAPEESPPAQTTQQVPPKSPYGEVKTAVRSEENSGPPEQLPSLSQPHSSQCQKASGDCCRTTNSSSSVSSPDSVAKKAHRLKGAAGRIPRDILEDPELCAAIARALPRSHDFEVPRTIWRLRRAGSRQVALQLPDGLIAFGPVLGEIFKHFCPTVKAVTVLADATFGACCIDDLTCRSLGTDFLIHYGHSCLVPTDQTTVQTLYIHVTVHVDTAHLVETVRLNVKSHQKLAFLASVQFANTMHAAVAELNECYFGNAAVIPQARPLGAGETLGCTSPHVDADIDTVVFVCDGRFHLESAMIQNPHVKTFYRYDPMARTFTTEGFTHASLHKERQQSIQVASKAQCVGLILGTLGRQGSVGVLEGVENILEERGIQHFTVLLSEVLPDRLAKFENVDAFVQVACPRLSTDWGGVFQKPLLTPYEAHVAFGGESYQDVYPMDFYSNKGGSWANYGAHQGHGGSVGSKFRHLSRRARPQQVGYESA